VYSFFGMFVFAYANFTLAVLAENQSTFIARRLFDHPSVSHKRNKEGEMVRLSNQYFHRRVNQLLIAVELILLLVWWLLMALYYSHQEGWRFFDAVYFSFISLSTIGFGDFSPEKTRDSPMNYVFIFLGLFLASVFISSVTKSNEEVSDNEEEQLQKLKEEGGRSCGAICKSEFFTAWLLFILFIYTLLGGAMFRSLEAGGSALSMGMFMTTVNNMVTGNLTSEIASDLGVTDVVGDVVSNAYRLSPKNLDDMVSNLMVAQNCVSKKGMLGDSTRADSNEKWSLVQSTMFAGTIYSTIGYGNIAPQTDGGKLFVMAYFVPGIVIFARVSLELCRWLNRRILRLMLQAIQYFSKHRSEHDSSHSNDHNTDQFSHLHLRLYHFLTALGFMLVFLLLSGALFVSTESWDLSEAVWFVFVTSSTIGYGDYVPSYGTGRAFVWGIQVAIVFIGVSLWSLLFSIAASAFEGGGKTEASSSGTSEGGGMGDMDHDEAANQPHDGDESIAASSKIIV
jgi:hypothetical protein